MTLMAGGYGSDICRGVMLVAGRKPATTLADEVSNGASLQVSLQGKLYFISTFYVLHLQLWEP
jgi:hypothetical protein